MDVLILDASGQVVGGGAGNLAVVGKQIFPVGWTWLGPPGRSDYAFFGPSGYAYYLEVTERDGTTSRVDIGKVSGWYLVKPFPSEPVTDWEIQAPAKLVGLNYQGRHVYTGRLSEH